MSVMHIKMYRVNEMIYAYGNSNRKFGRLKLARNKRYRAGNPML